MGKFRNNFFILAYAVGGYREAIKGLATLFRRKDLDVDLLMVVVAIGAAAIGYWVDGAILIFIFSLSGTLTYGKPKMMDIVPFAGFNEKELLRVAASVETLSEHPVAKAIVREAGNMILSMLKELQWAGEVRMWLRKRRMLS